MTDITKKILRRIMKKIEESPRFTLTLPNYGNLKGRTRELIDGDDVIALLQKAIEDLSPTP